MESDETQQEVFRPSHPDDQVEHLDLINSCLKSPDTETAADVFGRL